MSNLPAWMNPNQHITRMPYNEYDKSTIISILPKLIDERKPTIYPGRFTLQPASFDKPELLVIGPSSWWKDTYDGQPLLEIMSPSVVVADSVVKDYCNGYPGSNGDESGPGLFWLPNAVELSELKVKYKAVLAKSVVRQNNWFTNLIRLADSLWARSNGNPAAISDDMRLAAKQLGLQEKKDWMTEFKMQDMENCSACGHMVNPKFPVCPNCRAIINSDVAAKRGIKFASA